MQYMLLIYSEPSPADAPPPSAEEMQAWFDYTDAMKDADVFVAGDPLHGIETATTVRVRDGQAVSTDGPFAETKEVLGGYYIVDTEDIDGALHWAERCPGAQWGSIEVRPMMAMAELAP